MSNGTMGAATAAPAVALTKDEARRLTDEVKADALALWQKLLRLYEGRAHTALGYESWGAYYEAEFGQDAGRGYQLLDAARVNGALEAHSKILERPSSDSVAREVKKAGRPKRQAEAWDATVKQHGPKPTAKQVRETVNGGAPKDKPKAKRSKRHKAGEPTFKTGTTLAYDDTVIRWVRDRVRRGWTREQIMDATKAGSDGWPGAKAIGSERDFGEIKLAIYYIERLEADQLKARLRKAKTPEARMRALRAATPPNSSDLLQVSGVVSDLVYRLDSIDVEDYELDDLATHALTTLFEDLMYLGEWWDRTLAAIQARLGDLPLLQRIEKLRAVTVENGAEPAEATSAQRRAAILQRKLDNRLGM